MAPAPKVADQIWSDSWAGDAPSVAALVSTYGRPAFLPELVDALDQQDLPTGDYEVVLVDNGSTDETWEVLSKLIGTTELRATAIRMDRNAGPAPGRNAGAALVRAPLIAITDDDCLPTPGWLRHVRLAFAGGADVVQGAVHADPAGLGSMGPWDHTIWVRRPTPFFETCNVAYRRSAFERVGGFDADDPLLHPPSGRAFGEDACLAWAVLATGGTSAFAPRALVHHRCIPSDYGRWLADQRELAGFPGLARRSPLVARWLHRGVFLDRRSERFDLAVLGVAAAVLSRRPWPLLGTLPWGWTRGHDALRATRGDRVRGIPVLIQLAVGDVVGLLSLLQGSARHRRVIL